MSLKASRLIPLFLLTTLLLAGCASLGSSSEKQEEIVINNVDDLVSYLGLQGYVLRPTRLTSPFALADIGYEYTVEGGRIRILEFDTPQAASRAVDEFVIDTRGAGRSSVFQHGLLMVAYAGKSTSVQLSLTHSLGPAVY